MEVITDHFDYVLKWNRESGYSIWKDDKLIYDAAEFFKAAKGIGLTVNDYGVSPETTLDNFHEVVNETRFWKKLGEDYYEIWKRNGYVLNEMKENRR